MRRYKVYPTREGIQAPCIYLEAQNEVEAEKMARQKSGLGRFESWAFIVSER